MHTLLLEPPDRLIKFTTRKTSVDSHCRFLLLFIYIIFTPTVLFFFFFKEPGPPEISPLSPPHPLPIPRRRRRSPAPPPPVVGDRGSERSGTRRRRPCGRPRAPRRARAAVRRKPVPAPGRRHPNWRSEEHTSELQSQSNLVCRLLLEKKK